MLLQEKDFKYVVYPPWAEGGYAYSWSDLPEILRDPLQTGRMKSYADDLARQPLIFNPPVQFVDGPVGGGIIVVGPADPKALNVVLFSDVANDGRPDEMFTVHDSFTTYVGLIAPFDGLGGLIMTGKRARNVCVRATPEHADAAGDSVYWAFCLEEKHANHRALAQIPQLAGAVGLRAVRVDNVDERLIEETQQRWWYQTSDEKTFWYEIGGCDNRAGMQYAILLYIASYLQWKVRGIRWAHLIAQIEGRPNARLIVESAWRKVEQHGK